MGTSTCVFPQVMGFLDGKLNVNNWQYLSGARGKITHNALVFYQGLLSLEPHYLFFQLKQLLG